MALIHRDQKEGRPEEFLVFGVPDMLRSRSVLFHSQYFKQIRLVFPDLTDYFLISS